LKLCKIVLVTVFMLIC